MSSLTNRLELPPAKPAASTFLLQDDVNTRQIKHQGGLIQAANPSKATDLPVAHHGVVVRGRSSASPSTAVRVVDSYRKKTFANSYKPMGYLKSCCTSSIKEKILIVDISIGWG